MIKKFANKTQSFESEEAEFEINERLDMEEEEKIEGIKRLQKVLSIDVSDINVRFTNKKKQPNISELIPNQNFKYLRYLATVVQSPWKIAIQQMK